MFNIAQINRYSLAMQRRGYPAQAILAGTNIDEKDLTQSHQFIDARQYQMIVANMLSLSGNEALGLELGQEVDYGEMGILGYAMMSSATIRRAVSLWLTYSQSVYGTFISNEMIENQQGFTLLPNALLPIGPAYRFCIEEFLMLSREAGLDLSGQQIVYEKLELAYPKPAYHEAYEALFACPIRYNADRNIISIQSPNLDTPIQKNNRELNAMYLDFCEKLSGEVVGRSAMETHIHNIFVKRPEQLPSATELAAMLNLSERSLRRQLRQQGTSYRELVQRFRTDLASEYLLTTKLSSKEIAFQLGYTDTSHFQKAFKARYQLTAKQYRQKHTQH